MVIAALSMLVFDAAAYTMPADKLLAMSNKQLCDKAQSHWDKNELDSALICFNIVANRADKKQSIDDMHCVCSAITAMGNIYQHYFYDYEKAMQCYLKSEKIEKQHQFKRQLAHLYFYMATLETEKYDVDYNFAFCKTGFEFVQKAFKIATEQDVQHVQVLSAITLATTALRYGNLDLVGEDLRSFLRQPLNDTIFIKDYARQLCSATIHASQGEYDAAIADLQKLEKLLIFDDNINDNVIARYMCIAIENRFFVYRDMNNHPAALQELDKMEQIVRDNDIKEGVLEVLLLKRDYHATLGNNALADQYDLEYHKTKDKFLLEAKVAKVDEEKVLFKLNEANHEIKELSYKQRIQQTELIAVAVVAVLLLALLLLAWLSHRRTKQKNETLYQHNMQLMANEDRLRRLQQTQEQSTSTETVKYRRSNMEGDDIAVVMEKVDHVMESCTEIFSSDFTLDRLAELTGESRIRLSQAINKVPGRTFYSILNGYRVREACRRMDDKEQYSGLTIEAIGQSVGFKNRSSFVAIFKRITGLTPSAYLKQTTAPDSQPSESQAS